MEAVIYSAILAIIVGLSIGSILSVYNGFNKAVVESRISRNGELALDRIVRDIRSASSTDTGVSVFGAHPGVLRFGTVPIKYSLSSTTLQRQESEGVFENITSPSARVTNLIFYRGSFVSSQVSSEIIKVEFTLESGDGKFLKTKKFFGSAVLRGSY